MRKLQVSAEELYYNAITKEHDGITQFSKTVKNTRYGKF